MFFLSAPHETFLDTNTISLMERENDAVLHRFLEQAPPYILTTVITVYEQIEGRVKLDK